MTTNPDPIPPLTLAAMLLERARLDLCLSDGDLGSRGAVIQPDELPRLGCRYAPLRSSHAIRLDVDTLGDEFNADHRVYRPCVGTIRGVDLGANEVLNLLRYMLDLGAACPPWATRGRVPSEVHFLMLERGVACCEAHQNSGHRPAWIGRAWLAEYGSNAVGATKA